MQLQMLPSCPDGSELLPVSAWPDVDNAWTQVTDRIIEAVASVRKQRQQKSPKVWGSGSG